MILRKRLLALALVIVLVLPGVLLSPALPVAASSGTGAADEINIIKVLDMALNRGGISMSPVTIQAFLNYWWSSVQSDLSKCINNASDAITTTQAFSSYVISALENSDHYDKLGSIMIKYVQYVCAMEGKSLSDIKQLLTQEGTFRRWLLSYIVDEDGNIAGTVDNKLKKYQLKSGLVNIVRQAADSYIEEYEGYYLVKSHKYTDLSVSDFKNKDLYDSVIGLLRDLKENQIFFVGSNLSFGQYTYSFIDLSEANFVLYSYNSNIFFRLYNNDWTDAQAYYANLKYDVGNNTLSGNDFTLDNVRSGSSSGALSTSVRFMISDSAFPMSSTSGWLYTSDGHSVKIWKTLDAFKNASIGKSDIYYTNSYSSYDSSVDNSVEFSGSYYSSNSNSYSHDIIQNTIDNSSEINESTINNITNQTITNITNNYGGSGDSSGSGSGGSGDSGWNIGEGISAFIRGVMELLDFLLKLLGDLVGLLATFATSVLDVLKSLAVVGTGFGDFLKECFGFLPEECISLIISSIGGMCIVGIIKVFKK